ncbi:MAG: dTDP-glucose 4,6-dehydratase [Legionellales bacterium]|nr:dTDP-glucose 4,6-dehydratase [Legionellales bacterium]
MKNRNSLLVTGGAGFIGANFCHYWCSKYPDNQLVVIDSLTYAANKNNISDIPNIKFYHEDINNLDTVIEIIQNYKIDTIVHFAADSHVDNSIQNPDNFVNNNILGTYNLLKAAKKTWLDEKTVSDHRFHHISTDEVYGSLDFLDKPFTELTPYDPSSPYSATKAASDHLVNAFHKTFNLNITTSNCSNNYGKFQHQEKLIPKTIINIANGEPIPVYGDGKNIRDWINVDDHCHAIDLILQHGTLGSKYNVGGSTELSNIDLIKQICEITDNFLNTSDLSKKYPKSPIYNGKTSESLICFVKDRLGHDLRYAIDYKKIQDEIGYKPKYNIKNSIGDVVKWYLGS